LLKVLDTAFTELEAEIRPGVTPVALAAFLERLAHREGVLSSIRGFRGFPAEACISVNDVFVNAIPTQRPIRAGDLVNIQFGVRDGLDAFAHQTWAYSVGEPTDEVARLLHAGVDAIDRATLATRGSGCVGAISAAIQAAAQEHACEPNHHFQGSGFRARPFEPPAIPCYSPSVHDNARLEPGMILLVQAILHSGDPDVEVLDDQWSVRSRDGRPAMTMSRMLLVTPGAAQALTPIRTTKVGNAPRGRGEVV
jgi:methionyl aminopeptidase